MAKQKKKPRPQAVPPPVSASPPRRGPAWLAFPALAVWLLAVLAAYSGQNAFFSLDPFEPPVWLPNISRFGALLKYLPQAGLMLLLSVCALLSGGLLLKAIAGRDNKDIGPLEWPLFALGLGFGALSLSLLGLGALGFFSRPALLALLGAALLAGALRFRDDLLPRFREFRAEAASLRFSWYDRALMFCLALWGASALIWALTPEIFFDSLVYHLATPAYYINEGRLAAQAGNLHSASPLLMQVLYGAGLLLSDDTLAKLVHFSSGCFLLATLFAFGRRWFSVTAGLAACAIYCSMPMAGMNLAATGVELGSAWFTALAACALISFAQREGSGNTGPFDRTLLLAGVLAGLAAGTKYPALFTVVAGAAVLLLGRGLAALRADWRGALARALSYCLASALVFSPWMIKNLAFHGNPLYPYFHGLFGGQAVGPLKWAALNSDCYSRDLAAVFRGKAAFLDLLLHPWRLTMSGSGNADFVGPMILACLPLPLLFRAGRQAQSRLGLFAAVMWLLWALSTTMPRYLLPGLALISLFFAAYLAAPGACGWALKCLLAAAALYSAQWQSRMCLSQDGWRVVFGLQDKASYLSSPHQTYPMPYYSGAEYINSSLPPDARVLVVGDSRGFYLRRRFEAASVYDYNPLVKYAKASATPEELQRKLAAAGFTHIFLNLGEGLRSEAYRLMDWDDASIRVFDAWWDLHAELAWSDVRQTSQDYRLLFVYRLSAPPRQGPPPQNHIHAMYQSAKAKGLLEPARR